jgi:hypothetical protein
LKCPHPPSKNIFFFFIVESQIERSKKKNCTASSNHAMMTRRDCGQILLTSIVACNFVRQKSFTQHLLTFNGDDVESHGTMTHSLPLFELNNPNQPLQQDR